MTPVHKSKIYVCKNIPNSTLTCVSFGPRRAGIILLLSESEKRKEKESRHRPYTLHKI